MTLREHHREDDARARRQRFLDDALFNLERGISVIPVVGKSPPKGFSLKTYAQRLPTEDEIRAWAERFTNLANVCGRVSRLVGWDADSPEMFARLRETLPKTAMMTASSRGKGHLYFRITEDQIIPPRVKIGGMQLDFRAEMSYLLSAHSIHPVTGEVYQRLGSWELKDVPYFDPAWIDAAAPTSRRIPDRLAGDEVDVLTRIVRARAYLTRLEPAVAGAGGHNRTMYAAACLVQKFGLTIEQAWPLLLEFNDTKCSPKWTARELLHKLESAAQNLHTKGQ